MRITHFRSEMSRLPDSLSKFEFVSS